MPKIYCSKCGSTVGELYGFGGASIEGEIRCSSCNVQNNISEAMKRAAPGTYWK